MLREGWQPREGSRRLAARSEAQQPGPRSGRAQTKNAGHLGRTGLRHGEATQRSKNVSNSGFIFDTSETRVDWINLWNPSPEPNRSTLFRSCRIRQSRRAAPFPDGNVCTAPILNLVYLVEKRLLDIPSSRTVRPIPTGHGGARLGTLVAVQVAVESTAPANAPFKRRNAPRTVCGSAADA